MNDKQIDLSQIADAQARDQVLSGILASDLAVEISAEFNGRRAVGFDVPSATAHVLGKYHSTLASAQDGPVFLLALAALQIRADFLQAVIRDAAIDLIETGEAAAAYKSADFSQRKAVGEMLDHFSAMLTTATATD